MARESQGSRSLGRLILRDLEPGNQETHHTATCGETPEPGPQGEVPRAPCSPLGASKLLHLQGRDHMPPSVHHFHPKLPPDHLLFSTHGGLDVTSAAEHYLEGGEQQMRTMQPPCPTFQRIKQNHNFQKHIPKAMASQNFIIDPATFSILAYSKLL